MNIYSIVTASLVLLLTACGGGGGDGGSASTSGSPTITDSATEAGGSTTASNTSNGTSNPTPTVLTGANPEVVDIPPTVTSDATQMSEMVVPNGFSYDPVVSQSLEVDISSYSISQAYVSIYGGFVENPDGSYSADYNSRITAKTLESGFGDVDYLLADSQYYMLAEVFFYDGTTPIQMRITNEQTQWVW
ncbi:hypothetical protein A1OO_13140 [Enterovibrio norvegicus FF-33]|uniref:hypothetical protein n=1 Tax=Enterovibrio norvegicus TaxID=188144 RepID=UPI000361A897|nr:hypothetical protein [Enterovibrio norvegicus]OEE66709.1 hypothetical protein A1OO_13140 [Enterovibrio norvegicus FF-33]